MDLPNMDHQLENIWKIRFLQGLGQPAGLGHFAAEQSDQRRQLGHGQPSQLPVDRDLVKDFKTNLKTL